MTSSKLLLFSFLCLPLIVFSQTDSSSAGVAVTPSTLRFNAKPGTTQTKTIKIHNDTKSTKKFQIKFNDFGEISDEGKGINAAAGSKYALSKWVTVSPTYLEVPASQSKSLTVTLNVPNDDSAAIAAWTMIIIDQVTDRKPMEVSNPDKNTLGLGIYQGIGFGIYVYQNPPNVISNHVEIKALKFDKSGGTNKIVMSARNIGDGIGFCSYYLELTNLNSGKTDKLNVRRFTLLPGYTRNFKFDLPSFLAKGKYSGAAVLDFGSKDDIETAEIEFEIN